MASIKIKIEGQAETIRQIGIFQMEMKQDFINLVKTTSSKISRTAKGKAPVSKTRKSKGAPGDLKRSIRAKYFDGGLSSTVVPRKPKGAHRHLVEYGTGQRSTRNGANRGKMPAKPFMGPAEQSVIGSYNQAARGIVDRDKII